MSDLKVLRLIKKSDGELPAKAFTAKAVAQPEPKPAIAPVTRLVPPPQFKPSSRRGNHPRKHQDKPSLSPVIMLQIFPTTYLSRPLEIKEIPMKSQNPIFF